VYIIYAPIFNLVKMICISYHLFYWITAKRNSRNYLMSLIKLKQSNVK